ncbi:acyl-CoA dehydrogenase family protein [Streptomyces qinglanensis]|uniref:Acyl-CoA dehydrogenase n=1 Tax=Streptomyces qinglanensis TaxID=943816 RepID=A0A1H9W0J2_9ACTN|nr:acyl-CoA dehydrogenase family protein [Streptomyces qinglanensis]SES27412.1 Acyl-CoA dehydrogenase [Streptomyces qinglanensis]
MDTAFTEEQEAVRHTVRDLLARRCGPEEVKAAVQAPEGYDTSLWHILARQLGLPGLALPETYGGAGCGTLELALAFEEAGRTLLPSPLLPTAVLAAPLVAGHGSTAQRDRLLPLLASGELTATLAVPGRALAAALGLTGSAREWAGGGRAGGVQARRTDAGWRLYGEVAQVLGGHSAGLLLVAAHTGGFTRSRTPLFLVRGDAPGLVRTRHTVLDETRPAARIQLRDVEAAPLGPVDGGDSSGARGGTDRDMCSALRAAGPRAAAVLAAEAVGAADGALTRTVEYVKLREQFGRPIGSFQAVRHRLADVYVQVQAARSAAYYAAWTAAQADGIGLADSTGLADGADRLAQAARVADGPPGGAAGDDPATVSALALAQALETQRLAAAEAVQLHGGIGFTWEHVAHLYFKRAAGDELLFGPVHRLRAHAADRAALFGPRARVCASSAAAV